MLGIFLSLPALQSGWFADDHWHRFVLLDPVAPAWLKEIMPARNRLDLFRFFDGDIKRNKKVVDIGLVPWWTSPDAKGAFFRPLSSLTHWIDHQLWPTLSWPMHAQSILWYGLLIAAVAILYRNIMGIGFAAGCAALLYAIDDAHGPPIAFLANRNALLAVFFGVLSIIAYDRSTRSNSMAACIFAPLFFLLGLLGGEAGIATLAYVAAHVLCLDQRAWRERFISCIPLGLTLVLWRLYWSYAGYGVANIGVYIDPLHDPILFLTELLHRVPVILFGQASGLPPDIALLLGTNGNLALRASAITFVLLALLVLWRLLRTDAIARFWATGMTLAAIPVCATFPSDRLMLFLGIGAFGLIARAFERGLCALKNFELAQTKRNAIRAALASIMVIHAIFAPIAFPLRISKWFGPSAILGPYQINTPFDESVTNQTVVVINTPMALMVGGLAIRNAVEGIPIPRRLRILSPSAAAVELFRADDRTLMIRPSPPFLSEPFDRLFRSPHTDIKTGEVVQLSDMTVTVTSVDRQGHPDEVTYKFETSLDHPSLRWLEWTHGEYVETAPPPIGEKRIIPMKLFGR